MDTGDRLAGPAAHGEVGEGSLLWDACPCSAAGEDDDVLDDLR